MNRVLVLSVVLIVSSVASATLSLHVDGVIEEGGFLYANPGDILTVSLINDNPAQLANTGVLFAIDGAAAINISSAACIVPDGIMDFTGFFDGQRVIFADCAILANLDKDPPWYAPMPVGDVVSGIKVTMGSGSVYIRNTDTSPGDPAAIYAPVTIYRIPEPMTLSLLGLGSLFVRRHFCGGSSFCCA